MLATLAQLAVQEGCGRFEGACWTGTPRPSAFTKDGAKVLADWRICRVTGPELEALALQAA